MTNGSRENVFHTIMKAHRENEPISSGAPKIGFALTSYRNLDDNATRYLSDVPFIPHLRSEPIICKLC